MQSSLLGLALANKFFLDPYVGLPSAISVSFYLATSIMVEDFLFLHLLILSILSLGVK